MSRYRYDATINHQCSAEDVRTFSYRVGPNVTETTVRCAKCNRLLDRFRFTALSAAPVEASSG